MSQSTKKSDLLKGMQVIPLEEHVDQVMQWMGKGHLDLTLPEQRERLRGWLMRMAIGVADHCASQFIEATRRAIRETNNLIADPEFHARRKKRLADARDRRAKRKAAEPPIPEPPITPGFIHRISPAPAPSPQKPFRRK